MKNLKVGVKIMAGFLVIILLMVIIVGVVVITNTQSINNVAEVQAASDLQTAANDMLNSFMLARIQASLLISSISESTNASFRQYAGEVMARLEEIRTIIGAHESLSLFAEPLEVTISQFELYNADIERLIEENTRVSEVTEHMREMGGEVHDVSGLLLSNQLEGLKAEAGDATEDFASRAVVRANRSADSYTIADGISSFRIEMREVMISFDSETIPAVMQSLDDVIAETKSYQGTLEAQENIAIAQQVIDTLSEYRTEVDAFEQVCLERDETIAQAMAQGGVTGGIIATAVAEMDTVMSNAIDDTSSAAKTALTLVITIAAVSAVLAIGLAIIIMRAITKPVNSLAEIAEKLSHGDTNVDCKPLFSKDELGTLAKSFDKMVGAIKLLITDANMLVEGATTGQLSVRADASRHDGDYRRIVEGVNETVEALVNPIRITADALNELSRGNLGKRIEGEYPGEFKDIQQTINFTLKTIQDYISEVSAALSAMAGGDLTVAITNEFRGDFVELKNSINAIAGSLSEVMRNINVAADQVASGTQHVSDGSQAVSQGATEQASSIQELTATITEIAEQIRMTAENASEVNTVASGTREKASEGNQQMKQMQEAMSEINEASANISKIIKVIDDIAFQTNILALNAAVEAARAGVHGKGFAVVAEEVRNLAAKSANAAKETTDMIESSIQKTRAGTQIADVTAQSLEQIVEMVGGAVEALGAIANASNEQANGISQVNKGIEQLSQVVQSNSATSEESAAAAEELSSQAALLKQLIARFKVGNGAGSASSYEPVQRAIPAPAVPERPRALAAAQGHRATAEETIYLSDDDFGKY